MSPNPLSTILHRTWWVLLLRGLGADRRSGVEGTRVGGQGEFALAAGPEES